MHHVNHMECCSHMLWMIIQKSRHRIQTRRQALLMVCLVYPAYIFCIFNVNILIQQCLRIYMELSDDKPGFGRWIMAFSPQTTFQLNQLTGKWNMFRNINFTGEIKSGLSQNQHWSGRKYIFTDIIIADAPITPVINICVYLGSCSPIWQK